MAAPGISAGAKPDNAMAAFPERRLERTPCETPASIELDVASARLAVVVRNICLHGARVEGAETASALDRFVLAITHESGAVERLRARLVWRKDDAMGVEFVDGEIAEVDRSETNVPALRLRRGDIGLRYDSVREASDNSPSVATIFSRICRSPL
jgi:hypothetical protein